MTKHGLTVILTLYLLLAAGFAAVTPFGKAPDESAHALYVQHLVEERTLPVLRQENRGAYEFHQPPLFYVLASPAWAFGAIASPGAARMAARGVSILIGALGIWLIALLARTLWPEREAPALAAAGFAALLPMRLATAASVSNDSLAEAVFTASLLVMLLMLRNGADVRRSAALGVCLGLGVLTKSSDILLFPVALVALLFACQSKVESLPAAVEGQQADTGRKRSGRRRMEQVPVAAEAAGTAPPSRLDSRLFLRCAAVTFGVALLIGGGWMARNASLYGDPLGTKAFEQYFQDTPTPEQLQQLLGYSSGELMMKKVLPLTFVSFWGVFGHMELFLGAYPKEADPPGWTRILADGRYPPPSWLYPLLLLVTLVAVAGWGVQAFGRSGVQEGQGPSSQVSERRTARTPERLVLFLAVFLVIAAFLRFNTEFFQAQGRYLFPAMGPIALGIAGGWLGWWPVKRQPVGAAVLLVGMLALSLYALFGTVMPAY